MGTKRENDDTPGGDDDGWFDDGVRKNGGGGKTCFGENNDDDDDGRRVRGVFGGTREDDFGEESKPSGERDVGGAVCHAARVRGEAGVAGVFGQRERDTRGRDERKRVDVRVRGKHSARKRGQKRRSVYEPTSRGRSRTVSDRRETGREERIYRGVLVDEKNDRKGVKNGSAGVFSIPV